MAKLGNLLSFGAFEYGKFENLRSENEQTHLFDYCWLPMATEVSEGALALA